MRWCGQAEREPVEGRVRSRCATCAAQKSGVGRQMIRRAAAGAGCGQTVALRRALPRCCQDEANYQATRIALPLGRRRGATCRRRRDRSSPIRLSDEHGEYGQQAYGRHRPDHQGPVPSAADAGAPIVVVRPGRPAAPIDVTTKLVAHPRMRRIRASIKFAASGHGVHTTGHAVRRSAPSRRGDAPW